MPPQRLHGVIITKTTNTNVIMAMVVMTATIALAIANTIASTVALESGITKYHYYVYPYGS